jgi:hypothetical protein
MASITSRLWEGLLELVAEPPMAMVVQYPEGPPSLPSLPGTMLLAQLALLFMR